MACAKLVKGKTIRWGEGGMKKVNIDYFLRNFAAKWSRENLAIVGKNEVNICFLS